MTKRDKTSKNSEKAGREERDREDELRRLEKWRPGKRKFS